MSQQYLIALDFHQDRPYYIRKNADGSWEECYSPVVATRFPSEKKAVQWATNHTTFGEYARGVEAEAAIADFQAWVEGGMVRRQMPALNTELSRKYDAERDDRMAVLEWRYQACLKGDDPTIRFEDYRTWPDLYTLFKCLWSWQRFTNRDYTQWWISMEIRVDRETKFEDFKSELDLVLDKLDYRDEDGDLVLPIFDRFLSEGGNKANLLQHPDGTWSVDCRYYEAGVEHKSLEECFKYIRKHRYYEGYHDEED